MSSVVVHYGELALKGRNRPWFINTMVRSIRSALKGQDIVEVRALIGRIVVTLGPGADWAEIRERLSRLPGISYFSRATHVPMDLEAIADAIVADLADHAPVPNFRIMARRADKRFPIPSPDIERAIGARVQQATGWPVDLSHPAFVIRVEVLSRDAFYFFDRVAGTGGLPVGTGGKVMSLLSGGIDSPVAAWRLIRRGCRSHFVHFHSHPILSRTSQDKVREVVRMLTRHQLRSRLFLVPFAPIQQQVVVSVPPPLRVVVYRRLMMRIAEQLAIATGAQALVTGDSVGQVASQTVDNLAVVGRAASMQILRPLVGMDKEEITRDAQKIGTYETSIIPDEDCCTLFTPRFPTTRATTEQTERAESGLDVASLVQQAVDAAELEDFRFPVLRLAASFPTTVAGDRT